MRNTFNVLFYIKKTRLSGMETSRSWGASRSTESGRSFHAPLGRTRTLGRRYGACRRAEQCRRQNQRTAFEYPLPHRKVLQQVILRTIVRNPLMVKEMYFGANLRQETVLAFSGSTTKNSTVWSASAAARPHIINIGASASIWQTTSGTSTTGKT